MISFKHILVPVDFSDTSEGALSAALDLARLTEARLTLLHVWTVPNTGYAEALAWPVDELERSARAALDQVHARVSKLLPKTDAELRCGIDWEAILEVVKEHDIDLIVMGTHGRRGLKRLIIGSVAEKIVRLSPVPVLTIRGSRDTKSV